MLIALLMRDIVVFEKTDSALDISLLEIPTVDILQQEKNTSLSSSAA